MPLFPVSGPKQKQLIERMQRLGIREEDLDESFVRSSGPGGQNVNKTSTAVVLVHRPTGITVKCQEARSQGLNRFLARRLMLDRIEGERLGAVSAERKRVEKIRRQKRRRSRRAKEKMLANKRHQAVKKRERGAVRPGEP
ncbi:MAG TPA: peptide chain release factor-like protein [Nitrospiria bacterium]|jgi:protein subunit release factor B|nr:peptide chain release factor-like protein [Nitrospiria bacterium]